MEKQFEISPKILKFLGSIAVLGVLLLIVGAIAASADGHQWWGNILVNGVFFIGLAGFAALFVAAHTLADSGWHVQIQRIPEAMGTFLPIGGLLMLLVLPGIHSIYHWSHPGDDALLMHKAGWLNIPFFSVRTILYVAIWSLVFMRLRKISLQFSGHHDVENYKRFKKAAGIFAVLFVFTFYISAWDWLMSVDPHWYSTIYSFLVIAGMLVSAIAFIAILLFVLNKMGYFLAVGKAVYGDLGSYLFAFSIVWGYLCGAQYLLIWYSNIPEEAVYYTQRIEQYSGIFTIVVILNFAIPFLALLSRGLRRVPHWVAFVAAIILMGQWMNVYLLVMPGVLGKAVTVGPVEIGLVLVYLALFLFVVFKSLSKAPLQPEGHPFLVETESH
jgi:hypothetical protein